MLQLFFVEDIDNPELVAENAHHAERVLRMKVGEQLLVSNGQGSWARAEITSISKRSTQLKVIEQGFEAPEPIEISVLQALPKNDRARETVELLTAAGVSNIYPWQAARSIGKESEKWAITAIEASKQSRRFTIPKVTEKLDTQKAVELIKDFDQVLVCHEAAQTKISDVIKVVPRTLIIIGPEGGITDEELDLFKASGGELIRLGRPVLRSAHAGIAAISAVSALKKVW